MWPVSSGRKKLLFAHERFGALGGAESNILTTARELQQREHTVGILHGPPTGKGEAAWSQTFQHRFPLAPQSNASRVRAALQEFQPDAVYVHKMADLEVLEALLEATVPVVRMVHDHDLYCMRSYRYNYFTRRICERRASLFCVVPCCAFLTRNHDSRLPLKWVSYLNKRKELRLNRRFHRMVVATRFMKEELRRNGFEPNQIEIHSPVPCPGDSTLCSTFSHRNLVLYTGQVIRGKGVDVLLESLARVRVRFECLIFGDGNHRAFCERRCRELGLTDRVHFKGYVPPDQLKQQYQECSVVVMSSAWPEPFGAAGLEAMRYGIPVVAFDVGGIKEWLIDGQNGYHVPWMDRGAFAARVEELLQDKVLAQRLGQQAREMVAESYDFSKYIDGLEDLFARVADGSPQGQVA